MPKSAPVPRYFPGDLTDWMARNEGVSPDEAAARWEAIERGVESLARRLASQVCGRAVAADPAEVEPYARRLADCLTYHWKRLGARDLATFAEVVECVETGDLGYEAGGTNLLADVTLAVALERKEPRAAAMFDTEYMPRARATARRLAGQRGADEVDNFAAELLLPREGRPPRIALYQGKTSLASWLRAVVANFCVSRLRRQREKPVDLAPERLPAADDAAQDADRRPCEELLRPIFTQAVAALEAEDRLLITMLVLDQVPQKDLARTLGINSGNVTRRRQRIAADIFSRVQKLAARGGESARADQCMHLVLAGDDVNLRRRLGDVLASALRGTLAEELEEA